MTRFDWVELEATSAPEGRAAVALLDVGVSLDAGAASVPDTPAISNKHEFDVAGFVEHIAERNGDRTYMAS